MSLEEALEAAVQEEAEAVERYQELARQAEDPESRLLFEQLSREEAVHYQRLSERLKAVKLLRRG